MPETTEIDTDAAPLRTPMSPKAKATTALVGTLAGLFVAGLLVRNTGAPDQIPQD